MAFLAQVNPISISVHVQNSPPTLYLNILSLILPPVFLQSHDTFCFDPDQLQSTRYKVNAGN